MTATTIAASGARLHVLDEGDPGDPPIVLLHAGIADLRAWDALVPLLLAAGYRVVRFDARGFGRTETEDVQYSNRHDVLAVMDGLGIERAALVGNSRGGAIAIDTAIEAPDRIVALVGVAAGVGGFVAPVTEDEEAVFERMEALEESLDEATGEDRERLVSEIVDLDLRFWVDGPGQSEGRVPAPIREAVRAMDLDHYAADRVDGQPTPMAPRAADRLAELTMPVLMVAGALDVSETVATAQEVAATAPAARVEVLDGVAHMIGMEAPERLAALIDAHLRPLRPWG